MIRCGQSTSSNFAIHNLSQTFLQCPVVQMVFLVNALLGFLQARPAGRFSYDTKGCHSSKLIICFNKAKVDIMTAYLNCYWRGITRFGFIESNEPIFNEKECSDLAALNFPLGRRVPIALENFCINGAEKFRIAEDERISTYWNLDFVFEKDLTGFSAPSPLSVFSRPWPTELKEKVVADMRFAISSTELAELFRALRELGFLPNFSLGELSKKFGPPHF